jgi:arylsulfatase A-like enzyme
MRAGLLFCVSALVACGSGAPEYAPERPPSVVLLVVDTLREDAINGGKLRARTPGFDSLAEDGVVYRKGFAHAPMTLPAHTSLFSSRLPFETGVLNNFQEVRADLPLLAEHLREHGYQTHAVVSLGTLNPRKQTGLDRGFDVYDQDYWHMDQAERALGRIQKALDAIDPAQPFFLFAHFSDPHSPYNAHGTSEAVAELVIDGEAHEPVETSDMTQWDRELDLEAGRHTVELRSDVSFVMNTFEWTRGGTYLSTTWEEGEIRKPTKSVRIAIELGEDAGTRLRFWISENVPGARVAARYRREVEYMDPFVGNLLDELRTRGLYDGSVVILTSDHGEALGERGVIGHVQNLHDEMLNVPLVLKAPQGHPGAARLAAARDTVVPQLDLVPTILDLLGLPDLPGQRGHSLLLPREPLLLAQTHRPESKRDFLCLRDAEYKLIYAPVEDRFQMFDLVADPGETIDVFAERRDQRPTWPDHLREVAELAASGALFDGTIDPETREQLEALGYFGN